MGIAFELSAAVAIWFSRTRVAASWAIAVVMWFFVLVQLRILLFFPRLDCGCFGKVCSRKLGFRTLAENIVFVALAIWMVKRASQEKKKRHEALAGLLEA